MRRILGLWLGLSLVSVAGCGEPGPDMGPVPVYPVSGAVVYNGSPAEGVDVYLLPTSAPMVPQIPHNPSGKTDAAGKFSLSTYAENDGAAEGGYQVVLRWKPPAVKGEIENLEEADTDKLLGWYDAANSKLTAQIVPGDNRLPAFKLPAVTAPPAPSQGVPGRN